MPTVKVLSLKGEELRDIVLSDEVFGIEPHKQALFDAAQAVPVRVAHVKSRCAVAESRSDHIQEHMDIN